MKPKVIFAIQGEGRGHMTQAISLKQVLEKNGFEVACVLIGTSGQRQIPSFFNEKFTDVDIVQMKSPNFATRNNRSISVGRTVLKNFRYMRQFILSAKLLRKKTEQYRPQVIINFYEPIVALYCLFNKRVHPPVISVAHQYLGEHPDFEFPKGFRSDKFILKNYTRMTGFGSTRILALSFYPLNSVPGSKIKVVPPLLRKETKDLHVTNNDYLLCYLVNNGYRSDIEKWHSRNPEQELHVFTDTYSDKEVIEVRPKLFFHKLNDVKFLQYMAGAKGLISSAGFESICEAMYLDKPVLMVPVEGHFEQFCNSRDGFRAGAGIFDTTFNISRFLDWTKARTPKSLEFREWEAASEIIFMRNIKEVISEKFSSFPLTTDLLPV